MCNKILIFVWVLFSSGLLAAPLDSVPANSWNASEVGGDVQVKMVSSADAEEWIKLATGSLYSAPLLVRTGSDGKAVLMRGRDSVSVSADSVVGVAGVKHGREGGVTRINQHLGTLIYDVARRAGQSFEISTPYLIFRVKSAVFSIHVTEYLATVSLTEGSLELTDAETGNRLVLSEGQTATRRDAEADITLGKIRPAQVGEPAPAAIPETESAGLQD